ncbi:sensor of ECF-type sigma factor [Flavobacterium agrisoli]|uniref:Sensor of ECF-type sigma factor n=1 Tax=Flavobacterium agrisoli TaxID=2793066 RepID=A0A934PJV9_9FLAO|nr:sensor of ECF-type sigma factor [Flavobacterium agrisoli]MBK0368947.1 sensor of ECF-type sigma factor [Flavobacterium agrisoli]
MKTKNIFTIILLLLSISFYAQKESSDPKREKIKAYKISFLTSELNLTSAEAEKFWPMYTTYDDKQFDLRHKKMKTYLRKLKDENVNALSEKEALSLLNQIENTDDELYALKKKYNSELKRILPAKKIILLKKSEDDFNRKLLQQYRDKK